MRAILVLKEKNIFKKKRTGKRLQQEPPPAIWPSSVTQLISLVACRRSRQPQLSDKHRISARVSKDVVQEEEEEEVTAAWVDEGYQGQRYK